VSELPTRALSLYAPWAYAILYLGKDVENRDWLRGGRGFSRDAKFRGDFWLHASLFGGERGRKREDLEEQCEAVLDIDDRVSLGELVGWSLSVRGKIVGRARIVDSVTESYSRWFCGPVGLVIAEPVALAEQVPAKGALGFWTVPPDVLASLTRDATNA